nr:hypothetical protein [Tanacetum cinerariifolium]
MQQPMQNPKDRLDLTTAIDMTFALMAKALTLNNPTLTNNNQNSSPNPSNIAECQESGCLECNLESGIQIVKNINGLSVVLEIANQYGNGDVGLAPSEGNGNGIIEIANQYGNGDVGLAPPEGNGNGIIGNPIRCYNCRGEGHYASNCIVKPKKRDAAYLQQQLQMAQEEETGIQSTQEEFVFMAAADAYEENKRVKANCILENNLQQASTSVVAGFQTNGIARTKDNIVIGQAEKKKEPEQEQDDQVTRSEFEGLLQQKKQTEHINSTNSFNTVSSPINTVGPSFVNVASSSPINAAGTPASTNAFEEHPFE